jgi:hypothetical protein
MKINELDSIKKLEEQISGFKLLTELGKYFNLENTRIKNIGDIENSLMKLETELEEYKRIISKFNKTFSSKGWIAHDSMNFKFMKKCLLIFEGEGLEKSEDLLFDYYKPENIKSNMIRLKAVPEILKRFKFIEYAYSDYIEQKYYSVVPILLMIIDGSLNDFKNIGFHSDKADLSVWDSITYIDDGINTIQNIFRSGRKKTREEIIDLPYRNGILHGMDLGYDNYKVAAKCWHFLFIIRDWILAKKTESSRKEKFIDDSKPVSVEEMIKSQLESDELNEAIKNWKPREIEDYYIKTINEKGCNDKTKPETIVIEFLSLLKKKNYGHLANLFWSFLYSNSQKRILDIKNQFMDYDFNSYKIIKINDKAPAISEIDFNLSKDNNVIGNYTIRLIYRDGDNASSSNLKNGKWVVVYVEKK